MRYATLLLGLAIVLTSVAVAAAKVDRKCIRKMHEAFGETHNLTEAQIRRHCDDDNFVTDPNGYGWERSPDKDCKLERIKGRGAKLKRDAACPRA